MQSSLPTTYLNQKNEMLLQEHHRADEGEAPRAVLLSSEPPSSTLSSLFLPYISVNLASSSSVTKKGNQKQTQAEVKDG